MMHFSRKRRPRGGGDLRLLRILCASGTLLTSEVLNAPLERKPPAGPGPGGVDTGSDAPGDDGDDDDPPPGDDDYDLGGSD